MHPDNLTDTLDSSIQTALLVCYNAVIKPRLDALESENPHAAKPHRSSKARNLFIAVCFGLSGNPLDSFGFLTVRFC